jgi:hypothetical protein
MNDAKPEHGATHRETPTIAEVAVKFFDFCRKNTQAAAPLESIRSTHFSPRF